VILGADAGHIEGVVKSDRSEPVDGATITLVPTGSRRTRSFYKTGNTNAAGQFAISGIAPGSYKIFAWEKVDVAAVMYDPEFLVPMQAPDRTSRLHRTTRRPSSSSSRPSKLRFLVVATAFL
jgi:hypothetical protein